MKSRRLLIEISLAVFVIAILLWVMIPKFLLMQNYGMAKYFPDPVLRSAVIAKLSINSNKPFREEMIVNMRQNFNLSEFTLKNCTDLRGLEHFPFLTTLNLESYNIQNLNLMDYRNLNNLSIKAPRLELLDLSINLKLIYLNIDLDGSNRPDDKPFRLNIPKANYIVSITVKDSPNSEIDLSQYSFINELNLVNTHPSGKGLEKIDLTKNSYLTRLLIEGHPIKKLDLSALPELTHLYCSNNQISEIKFATGTRLKVIECMNNKLEELNLLHSKQLSQIKAEGNPIRHIQFHNSRALKEMYVDQEFLSAETLDNIKRSNINIVSTTNQ